MTKPYLYETIDNGLRIVLIPKPSTEVATVMVIFGVGSRQEDDKIAGISHVLEHMHYKGGKKRPDTMSIARFIESIGGEHNAFTGKEYTGYYAKVTPSHIEDAFDFLSDFLIYATISTRELTREKSVIIEEINMYEDLPMEKVVANLEEGLLGKNALGREIIGTKKSVSSLTRNDLIEYKKRFYFGSNAIIAIAGNFGKLSPDKIINLTKKYFPLQKVGEKQPQPIEITDEDIVKFSKKKTEQTHIAVGFRTVALEDDDFFALDVLGIVLGGGMSSRMFDQVREKRGLAYSVRTHTQNYRESGLLFTQAGVPHEKVYDALQAIMNEYRKVKTVTIPKWELDKAKEILTGKMLIKFEDSEELASHYATELILTDKIMTPKELADRFRAVTAKEIIAVARKYFTRERCCVSVVSPKTDMDQIQRIVKSKF